MNDINLITLRTLCINASLIDSLSSKIIGLKSAKEAWDALEESLKLQSTASIMCRKEFQLLQIKLQHIKSLVDSLAGGCY